MNRKDLIKAQTALIEHFDDDIDVLIREDHCLCITSTRVPSLDFVAKLSEFVNGSLAETRFLIGTSKVAPNRALPLVSGEDLAERIYKWRETQELAKRKQLEAKTGKTR